MGRAVYESSPNARRTFEEANDVLGYPLSEVCFAGPAERLDDTATAQPAILTTSVAVLEALAERTAALGRRITEGLDPRGVAALPADLRPSFVAGHSLGEFTALVAAGVLTFADALRLVAERGRLAATKGARGAMAAIVGLSATEVEEVIREVAPDGRTVVANDNGPAQVTIAGDADSVEGVMEALRRRGAKRIVPLRISGPFHFPPMGRIGGELRQFMDGLRFREPVVPVVANINGLPHASAETIPDALVRHLAQRVEWLRSVKFMREGGASTFVEIGAGQVVSGLVKRIVDARTLAVSDPPSIADLVAKLRGAS
ncbi:MAG: ACP S-malonyltransferase [Chloroflexota bacterium]|nr:ACP S-malonyltransferase [Chloroflexota bacterium]